MATRLSQMFKFLRGKFLVLDSEDQERLDLSSVKRVRSLMILIETQYKQWSKKLRENEKINQLLMPVLILKHQKEQLTFAFYLEQYCICSSIKRIFCPQLSSDNIAQFQ